MIELLQQNRMPETNPVNVVCMKWGTKYDGPYVNTLYAMVKRHLTIPHRFVCFTDNSAGFDSGIESFPLPFADLSNGNIASAWNKLAIFAPQLADLSGPALFLDLDLIVINSLDRFFEYEPGRFVIIKDWLHLDQIEGNSSVFRFDIGAHTEVLDYFVANSDLVRANYRNEQAYLCHTLHKAGKINYWPARWCLSFKRHCLPKWPLNWFKAATLPDDPEAAIIVFHGDPKPPQAIAGMRNKLRLIRPAAWVGDHWRS